MNKLFWYKELVDVKTEQDVEVKIEHGDEVDYETKKEVVTEQVMQVVGAFNLDSVVATRLTEDRQGIEVYLNVAYEQLIPNFDKPITDIIGGTEIKVKNKTKRVGGKEIVVGYQRDPHVMPMGVTLTDAEDIKRFQDLTNYPNV